jgi:ribose 5-phosphate isomerase A
MNQTEAKRLAARAALAHLPAQGVVGLGSGSTAKFFIEGVGELVQGGRKLLGVPTSEESRQYALRAGIELLNDNGPWLIDVCVDGADEVTTALDVIKGGGGCHTREKIVNHAAQTNIIIVDESKLKQHLGEHCPVPVEVLRFAHSATHRCLSALGEALLRKLGTDPFETDSGNLIYDLHPGAILRPTELERQLHSIPGVVETGLFVGRADRVIVAGSGGVSELTRPATTG